MPYTCDPEECDRRFRKLDEENAGTNKEIALTNLRLDNLTRAVTSLTKAVWAAVVAGIGTGFGFIIWYIQKL